MSNENLKKGVTIGLTSEKERMDKSPVVEDRDFSKEETTNQLLSKEEDFLSGLIEAAGFLEDEEQTAKVEIVRPDGNGGKKVLFAFRVRALTEREFNNCKKKHTKYVRNKSLGIKMPEDTDNVRYRSDIIYSATVSEDRKELWDNKEAWEALRSKGRQIMNGLDMIDECLKAGEKDRIFDVIEQLSGFDDNIEEVSDNLEDTLKN